MDHNNTGVTSSNHVQGKVLASCTQSFCVATIPGPKAATECLRDSTKNKYMKNSLIVNEKMVG
jgi:hypothetical protein